jgi:hypothetical protein
MIIHYPTIYQTVGDYCNHLFLVIGNGYEWNSGELPIGEGLPDFAARGRTPTEAVNRLFKRLLKLRNKS